MKKGLAIFFSLCLACFGGIFLTACNDELMCQHAYTNCCDKSCDICGEERRVQLSNIHELHEEGGYFVSDYIDGKLNEEYVFKIIPDEGREFFVADKDALNQYDNILDASKYNLKIYDENFEECFFEYEDGILSDADGENFLEENSGKELYFLITLNEVVNFRIELF